MRRKKLPEDTVVVWPARPGAVSLNLGLNNAGDLATSLTVDTDTWGTFLVPLTAEDLAVITTVANRLLRLDAAQAAALKQQLAADNTDPREDPTDG